MIDITIDTREQQPFHFPAWVKTRIGKVETGDYALTDDDGFAVERKSVDDFVGTIGTGWERFQRELLRAQEAGFPSFPVVVEGAFLDVVYSQDEDGRIEAPTHSHPKMTPALVLKRIGELAQLGGVVMFAGGRLEANMLCFALLKARDEELASPTAVPRMHRARFSWMTKVCDRIGDGLSSLGNMFKKDGNELSRQKNSGEG